MEINIKQEFLLKWGKYFGNYPLPIIFYYTNDSIKDAVRVENNKNWSCIIAELSRVRNGESLIYDKKSVLCGGAKRYLGFSNEMRPNFKYFLSCGIEGTLEGERYKKTPEIVDDTQKQLHTINAEDKYLVFKRWDKLTENDNPEVVIFFSNPDVLSGLFTLANFDTIDPISVITPFSSGCGSIIHYPYNEKDKVTPKAVIGMFDISARPFISGSLLTFSLPFNRFLQLINNMDESFLITQSWEKVKNRIDKTN